jgi:hypothetical protein
MHLLKILAEVLGVAQENHMMGNLILLEIVFLEKEIICGKINIYTY